MPLLLFSSPSLHFSRCTSLKTRRAKSRRKERRRWSEENVDMMNWRR